MNLYINSQYDPAAQRKKKQDYRNILQQQIKQKQNMKNQGRLKTQGYKNPPYNSSRFQSLQNNSNRSSKTKKMQQQSSFLPKVFNKQKKTNQSNDRLNANAGYPKGYSYDINDRQNQSFSADLQTIQALTQCEVIIQNLRKLRISSLNSIKRKIKHNSINLNSPQNYTERYPSGKRFKQSSADQQVRMFRQPTQRSTKPKQNFISKQKQKPNNKKSIQPEQQIDQNQGLDQSNQLQNNTQQIKFTSVDFSQQNRNQEQQLKAQQYQQKIRKRQKYLLKYLGKAKIRGSKLHQKILQFKNKSFTKQKKQGSENQQQQQIQTQTQKKPSQIKQKKQKNIKSKLNSSNQLQQQF